MNPSAQTRRRVRPEKSLLARTWWIYAIVLLLLTGAAFWLLRPRPSEARELTGYLTDLEELGKEYRRFQGKEMRLPDAEANFKNAALLARRHDYSTAASLLEQVVKEIAVPAVYNDLGVLYAELNDRGHAANAFREALSRDTAYRPVRENLNRLRRYFSESVEPVTSEIEPNNTMLVANLIPLNKPVDAEIGANLDQDVFKFNSPPPPRDLLAVEVANASATLVLGLRVYDSNLTATDLGRALTKPGESLTVHLAPPVNSPFYLQVWGVGDTAGKYTLTVKSMKAHDSYEPNDDVFSSTRISVGVTVEANIMDRIDTDVYSFVAPRTGSVDIDLRNKSATLIPALTTYGSDQRTSGFGPYVRIPGADLHHRMEVLENQTYYVQVWAQADTSGAYTLTVN